MVMSSVGHCIFCGRVHERGDARTDEDCGDDDFIGPFSLLRMPLDERLERTDGEDDS